MTPLPFPISPKRPKILRAFALLLLLPLAACGPGKAPQDPGEGESGDGAGEVPQTAAEGAGSLAGTRPNLVLIIADDMTWYDCGPYGNDLIATPNLDRMAAEGMVFEKAFLTVSSCSPSRASIITGRYPHNTDADELHWPLPGDQVTFVEKLREAGYWTGAAGKWHLGDEVRDRFDEIREVDTSGFQLPTGEAGQAGKFVETLEGEAQSGCTDWVPLLQARPKDQPFFLWLAALDPHRDYHEGILPDPQSPDRVRVSPYHPDTPATRGDYALYYDEIRRLDKYVGRVLDELEAQGVAEDTLVLFISDNGRPFPRDKTTLYDSGIQTPWIVRWPAKVTAGTRSPSLVSAVDIAPTFLELAGATVGETFEGVSTTPVLADPDQDVRALVFAEKNWHDYEDHARMARDARYKYIRNSYEDLPLTPSADSARSPTFEELKRLQAAGELPEEQAICFRAPRPKEELYDTEADPHELKNLVNDPSHAPALDALRDALRQWQYATGDALPSMRTADEFDRVTGKPTEARVRPRWSKARMLEAGLTAPE